MENLLKEAERNNLMKKAVEANQYTIHTADLAVAKQEGQGRKAYGENTPTSAAG